MRRVHQKKNDGENFDERELINDSLVTFIHNPQHTHKHIAQMDFCVTLLFLLLISIHCRLASCWLWLTDWSTHLRFRFLPLSLPPATSSSPQSLAPCFNAQNFPRIWWRHVSSAHNTRQTDLIGWKPFATRNSYLICSFVLNFNATITQVSNVDAILIVT